MAVRKTQVNPRCGLWLMLLVLIMSERGQCVEFTKNPSDKQAVTGKGAVTFTCAVNSNGSSGAKMRWFKVNGQELSSQGRLEIIRNSEDNDQSLVITNPELEDEGLYYCKYGNVSSTQGRLDVLPRSWLPICERSPSIGHIPVGEAYTISCTSTGHNETSLRWVRADSSGLDGVKTKSYLTTSIEYNGTVSTSDPESLLFLCEAKLGTQLSETCTVFINDEKPVDPIPFIVVGLMSLIAVMLFLVVLFILFRHRQCRFCREPMLEPHTVLDADALQTGAWVPPPVVAIDVSVSDEEASVSDSPHTTVYMNVQSSSQPPDVVPTQEINGSISETDQHHEPSSVSSQDAPNDLNIKTTSPDPVVLPYKTEDGNKRKSKTKNHTLTKNMDQNFEKPTQTLEKKALPSRKSRHPGKREKKIKHYKEPPVKARMKTPKDPIYAQVKKLNVPPVSVSAVAGGGEEDTPSTSAGPGKKTTEPPTPPPRPSPEVESTKENSSIATGDTDSTDRSSLVVNDLGKGDSKKNRIRHYRKKSEGSRKNSEDDAAVLNIPTSRSDGAAAKSTGKGKPPPDRIIYAELDFSKKVGLNIIE